MTLRRLISILLIGSIPGLTGCAAHYQDLLRDRDAEIRELEAQLADARSANAELARREQAAIDQLADAQRVRPAEASSDNSLAERVQRAPGLRAAAVLEEVNQAAAEADDDPDQQNDDDGFEQPTSDSESEWVFDPIGNNH